LTFGEIVSVGTEFATLLGTNLTYLTSVISSLLHSTWWTDYFQWSKFFSARYL